jgi:hypothetical protein
MRLLALFFAGLLLLAAPAFSAETEIEGYGSDGACTLYLLCDSETSAQTCGGAGNERYVRTKGMCHIGIFADESTSIETWIFHLYTATPGLGYTADPYRSQVTPTGGLTTGGRVGDVSGTLGDVFGIITGTLTTGNVKVTLKLCPCSD